MNWLRFAFFKPKSIDRPSRRVGFVPNRDKQIRTETASGRDPWKQIVILWYVALDFEIVPKLRSAPESPEARMIGVRSIHLYHVLVPLRKPIRHASFERSRSDNLVVRVVLDDGTIGFGEGVPRSYVTGETIESTFASLGSFDLPRALGSPPTDFAELVRTLGGLILPETEADPRGMAGNSARCALELALLDAYGRVFGASVGDAVKLAGRPQWVDPRPRTVRYSGAITAASRRGETLSAWKMRLYGFHQVKVKVGVEGQDDGDRLRRIRRILGNRVDIRVDANEAWPASEVVDRVQPLLPSRPSVLEQPVAHAEVDALREIRPKLDRPDRSMRLLVMLDESLCGYPDAVRAVDDRLADLLNVRLSKCGGIFPSLKIVDLAKRSGLGVQLGCHPGETGLLSAAGRHFAGRVQGISYVEGSYDRHVLAENLIDQDITFRYGGRGKPLSGPGLGVTVDPEALTRMTVKHHEVTYG